MNPTEAQKKARHTEGPWMQGPTTNTWHKVYQGKKGEYGGRAICTIHSIHANGARQREDFETEAANAAIIASAPELLLALRELLAIGEGGVIERNETGKPTWSALDEIKRIAGAAIAKAEGGAQ